MKIFGHMTQHRDDGRSHSDAHLLRLRLPAASRNLDYLLNLFYLNLRCITIRLLNHRQFGITSINVTTEHNNR
jgi:hypothetical protein